MHVVVTGASSGIGEAIAREMAQTGARLTLVARRRELLEKLGGGHFIAVHDLSRTEEATVWLEAAVAANGPVDVLINNAGVQIVGPTVNVDPDKADALLRLNLSTPLRITRAVLPSMIARGSGTIVDVASMAALAPTPGMTWYNASKGGLAAASESLRGELRRTGVHVVTVYPGIIDTAMSDATIARTEETLALKVQPHGNATELARRIRRAIEKKEARVIYPKINSLARAFPGATRWVMDRFTPEFKD